MPLVQAKLATNCAGAALRIACQHRDVLESTLPKGIHDHTRLWTQGVGYAQDAAQLAIDGGADFIKTSTGKGAAGATPENAEIMLRVIAENVKINKKLVGFKAAGGISNPEEAIAYAIMAEKIMGADYVNNQTFRIGASRLTNKLYSLLTF